MHESDLIFEVLQILFEIIVFEFDQSFPIKRGLFVNILRRKFCSKNLITDSDSASKIRVSERFSNLDCHFSKRKHEKLRNPQRVSNRERVNIII